MISEKTELGDDKAKLDLACWLIERNYTRREAIANRAAIVVSADSLLLAGIIFLLDKVLGQAQSSVIEKTLLALSITAIVIFLALSIVYAVTAIVSVWITNREKVSLDKRQRLFFHAYDTVNTFHNFEEYLQEFNIANQEQMKNYALGYLWSSENLFNYRYQNLRRALQLLLLSIIPFVVSIAIVLVKSF